MKYILHKFHLFIYKLFLTVGVLFLVGTAYGADYYWVGGNTTWPNSWDVPDNWRLNSVSGAIPTTVPTENDNVFFVKPAGVTGAHTYGVGVGPRPDYVAGKDEDGYYYLPIGNAVGKCKNLRVATGVTVNVTIEYYPYYGGVDIYGDINIENGAQFNNKNNSIDKFKLALYLHNVEFSIQIRLVGNTPATIASSGILFGEFEIEKSSQATVTFSQATKTAGRWYAEKNQNIVIEDQSEIGGLLVGHHVFKRFGQTYSEYNLMNNKVTIKPGATVSIATLLLVRSTLEAKNVTLNVSYFMAEGYGAKYKSIYYYDSRTGNTVRLYNYYSPFYRWTLSNIASITDTQLPTTSPTMSQKIDITGSTIRVHKLTTGIFASTTTSPYYGHRPKDIYTKPSEKWWAYSYFYNRLYYTPPAIYGYTNYVTNSYWCTVLSPHLFGYNAAYDHCDYFAETYARRYGHAYYPIRKFDYNNTDSYHYLSDKYQLNSVGNGLTREGYSGPHSDNSSPSYKNIELLRVFMNIQAVPDFVSTGSTIIFPKAEREDDSSVDSPTYKPILQASDIYNGGRVAPIVFDRVVFEDEGYIIPDAEFNYPPLGKSIHIKNTAISPRFEINNLEVKGGAYRKNSVYVKSFIGKGDDFPDLDNGNPNLTAEVTINNTITGTAGVSCAPLIARLRNVEQDRITVKTKSTTAINNIRLHGITGATNTANNSINDGNNTSITFNQPTQLLQYQFPTVTLADGSAPVNATLYPAGTTLTATFSASLGTPPYTFTYKLNDVLQVPITTAVGQNTVQKVFTVPNDLNTNGNANLSTFSISEVAVTDANGVSCNYLQSKWHYSLTILEGTNTHLDISGPPQICNGSTESYTTTEMAGATVTVTGPATVQSQTTGGFTLKGTGVGTAYITYGVGGQISPTVNLGVLANKRVEIVNCTDCDIRGVKNICLTGTTELTGYALGVATAGTWRIVSQNPAGAVSLSPTTGSSIKATVTGNVAGSAVIEYVSGSCTKQTTVTVLPPLNISATAPSSSCFLALQSVTLTGLPSTGPYSIIANDGTSSNIARHNLTGSSYVFSGLTQGKTYTFTVLTEFGCSASTQVTIPPNIVVNKPIVGAIVQPTCTVRGKVSLSNLPTTGTFDILAVGSTTISRNVTASSTGTYVFDNLPPGSYKFVVKTTGCESEPSDASAVINSITAIAMVSSPQSAAYCLGATATPLSATYQQATGTVSYQWYKDGTAIPASQGGTSATYTPNINAVGTSEYHVVMTDSCGPTSITSDKAKIEVKKLAIKTQPVSASYCPSESLVPLSVVIEDTSKKGTPTYQWYSNTTNSTTGGTLISGANSRSYMPPNTVGTTYYYVVITDECSSITSTAASILVLSSCSCTVTPTNSSICPGGNTNVVATYPVFNQTKANASTITWTSSDPSIATVTTPGTVGASGVTATVTATAGATPGSTVTITYTEAQGGATTTCTTEIAIAPPSVGGSLNNITYCSGATTGTTLTLTGHTGTVTGWERSASADFSTTITPIVNTTSTLDVNSLGLPAETYYFRAKVKSGTCAEVTSAVGKAVVVATPPTPTVGTITNPTCTSATGRVELSNLPATGSYTIVATPTSGTGTITKSGSGANFIFTDLVANTTYTFVVTTAIGSCSSPSSTQASIGTIPVFPVISGTTTICKNATTTLTANVAGGTWSSSTPTIATITPAGVVTGQSQGVTLIKYTTGSGCETSVYVTVTPLSVGGSISGDATVCTGTNSTTLTLSGHTGSVIRWESSTDNFATKTNIANTTTSLTATNLSATTKYRAIVQSGSCAVATSGVGTVTVTPLSVGGSISGDATVCTGTNSTTLTLSGHTGAVLRWESSTDNFTNKTNIVNTTTSLTATNLSATTKYRAIVQNGSCAVATSGVGTVTVNTPPTTTYQLTTNEICPNTDATLTLSGSESGVSYQLQTVSPVANVGTPVAGTGNAITFTVPNVATETTYQVVATQGACSVTLPSTATVGIIQRPDKVNVKSEHIEICYTLGTINLNDYITYVPQSPSTPVVWKKDGVVIPNGIYNTGAEHTVGNITKFVYEVKETLCTWEITGEGILYIKQVTEQTLTDKAAVEYCVPDATNINLNTILGQHATGSWSIETPGVSSSHLSGHRFNATAAYNAGEGVTADVGTYKLRFTVTADNSCLQIGNTAEITIRVVQ